MLKVSADFMRGGLIGGGAFLMGYLFRGPDLGECRRDLTRWWK